MVFGTAQGLKDQSKWQAHNRYSNIYKTNDLYSVPEIVTSPPATMTRLGLPYYHMIGSISNRKFST